MTECVVCGRTCGAGDEKRYVVKRGGERYVVSFCRKCHSVIEKEARNPTRSQSAGKAVKGVVSAIGAVGLVIMTLVFSVALIALKQIMKTKYGDDGIGNPPFGSDGSDFSSGPGFGGDHGGGEPMLDDFSVSDMRGYEVTDETGQVFQTDELVNQLYSDQGTFSQGEGPFFPRNQTFSDDEL